MLSWGRLCLQTSVWFFMAPRNRRMLDSWPSLPGGFSGTYNPRLCSACFQCPTERSTCCSVRWCLCTTRIVWGYAAVVGRLKCSTCIDVSTWVDLFEFGGAPLELPIEFDMVEFGCASIGALTWVEMIKFGSTWIGALWLIDMIEFAGVNFLLGRRAVGDIEEASGSMCWNLSSAPLSILARLFCALSAASSLVSSRVRFFSSRSSVDAFISLFNRVCVSTNGYLQTKWTYFFLINQIVHLIYQKNVL
jgi:hypothetical protein